MKPFKITFGADPEFFLLEKESKKIIPACGKVGGGKKNAVMISPDGGYLEDGAVVEFNVTPCAHLHQVAHKLKGLMTLFSQYHPAYELVNAGHHSFTKSQLSNNPQANVVGCEPDMWAWGFRDSPQINMMKNMRFAGGHIHVGFDPWPAQLDKEDFIKFLDICWLLPYLRSSDLYRMRFYGHPGLYRETPYGVEYRSPDPLWIEKHRMQEDFEDVVVRFARGLVKTNGEIGENLGEIIGKMSVGEALAASASHEWLGAQHRVGGGGWKSVLMDKLEI